MAGGTGAASVDVRGPAVGLVGRPGGGRDGQTGQAHFVGLRPGGVAGGQAAQGVQTLQVRCVGQGIGGGRGRGGGRGLGGGQGLDVGQGGNTGQGRLVGCLGHPGQNNGVVLSKETPVMDLGSASSAPGGRGVSQR